MCVVLSLFYVCNLAGYMMQGEWGKGVSPKIGKGLARWSGLATSAWRWPGCGNRLGGVF
jgi:hypothetical protein